MLTGEEGDVRIEVVNRGPTIDRSALDQIFDPLKRGPVQRHDTLQWPRARTYIVREVARAHGGEVDVRSDKGKTVFTVRLPRRNEAHRPEQDQRIPSTGHLKKGNITYVRALRSAKDELARATTVLHANL